MMQIGRGNVRQATISAKVFNADGTLKHDLGVVGYWHKSILKRLAWRVKQWLR